MGISRLADVRDKPSRSKFKTYAIGYVHIDIAEVTTWWSDNRSLDEALRWNAEVHARMRTLATNPGLHSRAREADSFGGNLRHLPIGLGNRPTHRILFRIDDEDRVVHVLRVRHVAREDIGPEELED